MLSREENDLLTRTGPGTPMGRAAFRNGREEGGVLPEKPMSS